MKRATHAREWLVSDIAALSHELEVLRQSAADFKTLKVAAGLEAPAVEKKQTRDKAEAKTVYLQQTMDSTLPTTELPLKRQRHKSSLFDSERSDFITEPFEKEPKRSRKKPKKSDYRQTQLSFKTSSSK